MKDDISSPQPTVDPAQRSLVDDIRELADAGKALAQAELAYQKGRASFISKSIRSIAILAGLVLVLLFCALLALTLGLILSLAPLLTPVGATAAVVAGFAMSAALGGMFALNHLRRLNAVIREPGTEDA